MSIARNLSGAYVPIRESRRSAGVLAALNSEIVHEVDGDESALVYVNGAAGTLTCTLEFTGTVDGTSFFPLLAVPYYATGSGTLASAAQPLIVDAINGTTQQRVYAVKCGQLRSIRVRQSVYTAGSAGVTVISDAGDSPHPAVFDGRPTSLMISATGAAAAAVTATLPLVAGLRHYVDFVRVTRSATALLTAAATPVVVTTTNLPGSLALTFGADASPQGTDRIEQLDWGGTGLAAVAAGVATTIVCPATTAVIWRVQVGYRIGL